MSRLCMYNVNVNKIYTQIKRKWAASVMREYEQYGFEMVTRNLLAKVWEDEFY